MSAIYRLLAVLFLLVPMLRAQDAYVISDQTSGHILDVRNGSKKVQIASLTKIASAVVVLDWAKAQNADLSQLAAVPQSAALLYGGQGVNFQPGDQCAVRDLVYAMLLQSDNQAAETLAAHVGAAFSRGGEPVAAFVSQMNALARKLGMKKTRFLNAHGLDNLEKSLPYSTAEDLAKLTQYAMSNPSFRFHVSQRERRITIKSSLGETLAYQLRNTNELLGHDGTDGVKTGTTQRAGQCLILSSVHSPESVERDGKHYITPRRINVIILGSQDRWADGRGLLAHGWKLHQEWERAGRPVKKRGLFGN